MARHISDDDQFLQVLMRPSYQRFTTCCWGFIICVHTTETEDGRKDSAVWSYYCNRTHGPISSLRHLIQGSFGYTTGLLCKIPFAVTEGCDELTRPGARVSPIKKSRRLFHAVPVLKQMPPFSILHQLSSSDVSNHLHVTCESSKPAVHDAAHKRRGNGSIHRMCLDS